MADHLSDPTGELATALRKIAELERRVTVLEGEADAAGTALKHLDSFAFAETFARITQALMRLQRDLRSLRDTAGEGKDKAERREDQNGGGHA